MGLTKFGFAALLVNSTITSHMSWKSREAEEDQAKSRYNMAGIIPDFMRSKRGKDKKDKKEKKEKDDIIVYPPDIPHSKKIGGVTVGENGQFSLEGDIPAAFHNHIAALMKDMKEDKFMGENKSEDRDEPVETRKKSQRGPKIEKGMSTAEILAMMRELCLPGNPWDVYTYVRVGLNLA